MKGCALLTARKVPLLAPVVCCDLLTCRARIARRMQELEAEIRELLQEVNLRQVTLGLLHIACKREQVALMLVVPGTVLAVTVIGIVSAQQSC